MVAALPFEDKQTAAAEPHRVAIVDIGSNSIRLVVFDGPRRVPATLFNEKVMAGLGRSLAQTGAIDESAIERAVSALERFRLLTTQMGVTNVRTVATAAVREATNGPAFLARLVDMGFDPELLSGEDEALMAGEGVLSGMPDAEGIVGDLGGGSLELVRIGQGRVHERASFPLGVLRIAALRARNSGGIDRIIARMIEKAGWTGKGAGLPFYMVGGSWRALARLDMHLTNYPLPIVHHYLFSLENAPLRAEAIAQLGPRKLRDVDGLSASRIPMLADAETLLESLKSALKSKDFIVSAYGLREGLLFNALPEVERMRDPLVCAARHEARLLGRFPEHGDLLDRWIAPLFTDEPAGDARLRLVACLLADTGWRAHPEFRAERGLDAALHGNWAGIDARGRAMVGHALYINFGGSGRVDIVTRLCSAEDLRRAECWGLALRLGQRLSGGVARALKTSRLSDEGLTITLHLPDDLIKLYGETVERRFKALSQAMGRSPTVVSA